MGRGLLLSMTLVLLAAGTAFAQGNSGKPSPRIAFEETAVTAMQISVSKGGTVQ